ncbi:hypothetical protein [Ralstonia pseudosolanacearum]|nr:hypothetical protein [Ralstonia pseudosolanacearum]
MLLLKQPWQFADILLEWAAVAIAVSSQLAACKKIFESITGG